MVKMKMFGFMPPPPPPPAKTKVASGSAAPAGKMFNMTNLASIMKVKSTGCKSCGA